MKRTLLIFSSFLTFNMALSQVVLNQTDDFEDGTTQFWRIGGAGGANGPVNVADGGPAGAGDNFLQYSSLGGAGAASKMVIYNQNNQWSGDFTAEGVAAVRDGHLPGAVGKRLHEHGHLRAEALFSMHMAYSVPDLDHDPVQHIGLAFHLHSGRTLCKAHIQ